MTSDESCLRERRGVEERRMEEERAALWGKRGRGKVGRRKRKTGKTKGRESMIDDLGRVSLRKYHKGSKTNKLCLIKSGSSKYPTSPPPPTHTHRLPVVLYVKKRKDKDGEGGRKRKPAACSVNWGLIRTRNVRTIIQIFKPLEVDRLNIVDTF